MGLNIQKTLNALGLASSANKLVYGETLLEKIKVKKVYLVIIVKDIGQAQFKKINNKCNFYNIKVINDLIDSDQLSKAIGKINIKAIGITDSNFIKLIEKNIN